ncbi:hypothetical protein BRADI_1g11645v3 [Brachypodium distachyon]|uniref:Uncharacterized protein n=1 Tax=Brachypodium distachyon TaxID=15368 RepID=A0A2K2DJ13_BRADI|nr:hypothetical protein BRADI_1g11645v3 [Brachypodium distachyon]
MNRQHGLPFHRCLHCTRWLCSVGRQSSAGSVRGGATQRWMPSPAPQCRSWIRSADDLDVPTPSLGYATRPAAGLAGDSAILLMFSAGPAWGLGVRSRKGREVTEAEPRPPVWLGLICYSLLSDRYYLSQICLNTNISMCKKHLHTCNIPTDSDSGREYFL